MQQNPLYTPDPLLRQAQQLLEVGRAQDAIKPLTAALAQDPQNTAAMHLLAHTQLQLDNQQEAQRLLRDVLTLTPDDDDAHHLLGLTYLQGDGKDIKIAEQHAHESLRIHPNSAWHHGLMAQIHVLREQWEQVLHWADRGLALSVEDTDCLNLRAHALTKLGRFAEARSVMDETLRQSPDDDWSHANQGWSLLNQNKPKKALVHFKESLRLHPGNEWAKAGLVEALKAKNPIYRLLLAFFLWMLRLPPRARFGVIFGGVIGYNVLRSLAGSTPALKPLVLPLIILYLSFVALTWTAMPLFNLLLRLSPSGRHALSDRQRIGSNLFAATLVYALSFPLTSLIFWLTTTDPSWFERAKDYGLLFGLLLLPASSLPGRIGYPGFKLRAWVMAGLMATGTASFALSLASHPIAPSIHGLTLLGTIVTVWWFGLSGTQTAER